MTDSKVSKWVLDAALAMLSIAVILILIEFFSPAAKVYSQPLELSFESTEGHRYTPEERAAIEEQFDRKIEAVESGQLSADLRRQRLHGPLYGLIIPLFAIGLFVFSWKVFLLAFTVFVVPFFLFGFVLPIEVFLCFIAAGLGWIIAHKSKLFHQESITD